MFEGRKANILIVDDNGLNRKKLKFAVETLGFNAQTASDGFIAQEMLATGEIDAVLLDMLMPVMDGFEVLEIVKDNPAWRDLPIIVISDLEGEPESVSRAIELGAEDFLPKGFDPVILNARLIASLRKKHYRDQEVRYFQRITALTAAAEKVETGHFDENSLALQAEARVDDPIGRLASVFQGMAKEIHAREVRLLDRILLLQCSMLLLLCAAASGVTPALSRLATVFGSKPLGMAVWVDIAAAVACLGITVAVGRFPKLTLADLRFFAAWAFLVGILQHVTVFVFATHVEATYLTMLMALESLLVFGFAAGMKLERIWSRRILGLFIGFVGIGIGLYDRLDGDDSSLNYWLIGAFVVPLIFAIETVVLSAKRPKHVDPVAAVGLMFAISLLFALPLAFAYGQLITPMAMMSPLGAIIIALALVSVLANVGYIYLLDLAGAVFSSQVAYATAIAGVIWGMLLLGERLAPAAWGAIVLLLLGMYLVETKGFDKPLKIKRDYRS